VFEGWNGFWGTVTFSVGNSGGATVTKLDFKNRKEKSQARLLH